jgi:Flavodoxin
MKALVVYESMWGNTRQVAEAIAVGLGGARAAETHQVDVTDVQNLDLLVVGGPTHAFSMSRPSTRRDARKQGAATVAVEDQGIREWLAALPRSLDVPVATFDTRVVKVRNLPGSAAKAADKELKRHHRGCVVDRSSFYVIDSSGPLADGELGRAEEWGAELAAQFAPALEEP